MMGHLDLNLTPTQLLIVLSYIYGIPALIGFTIAGILGYLFFKRSKKTFLVCGILGIFCGILFAAIVYRQNLYP